ncbi:MAG: glycosyltransferase [Kiritimatiellae bacterium]|nr:glycosyltransferase [Kiritimatiellia bacterium]
MNILFIAPQPFFRERGTPIRVRHQLEEIGRLGHRVDLVCYPFGEPIHIPGVRILRAMRLPGIHDVSIGPSLAKFPMDFMLFWKALGLCLRNRYDVIQAVEEAAFFAVLLAKLFRCRLVYNMDSHISDQLQFSGFVSARPVIRIAQWFERAAMRRASCVVTVGPVLTAVVRRLAPETRVLQLEDAPLESSFREAPAAARRLREELGLDSQPVCVYTGNFERYQGVADLVGAAGRVHRERPDVRFVLVGGTEAQVTEMQQLASRTGAGAACVFMGRRPTHEMAAFMTLANVLVTPRNRGTNPPMKIYAYMQSGRPIVSTDVPTHTQVLDEHCAFLTRPDPDSLARGVLSALADPARARAVAQAARGRVEQKYSLSVFQRKVRELYSELESSLRPSASLPLTIPA